MEATARQYSPASSGIAMQYFEDARLELFLLEVLAVLGCGVDATFGRPVECPMRVCRRRLKSLEPAALFKKLEPLLDDPRYLGDVLRVLDPHAVVVILLPEVPCNKKIKMPEEERCTFCACCIGLLTMNFVRKPIQSHSCNAAVSTHQALRDEEIRSCRRDSRKASQELQDPRDESVGVVATLAGPSSTVWTSLAHGSCRLWEIRAKHGTLDLLLG